MAIYSKSEIVGQCPAMNGDHVDEHNGFSVRPSGDDSEIYLRCVIDQEIKLEAGILSCRNVVTLCSTGCPLRDGEIAVNNQ